MQRFPKLAHIRNQHLAATKKQLEGYTHPHSHDFYEIEFMLCGSGCYSIDGTEYAIGPGSLYFMSPVNIHTVDARDVTMYNIMFSADLCDPGLLAQLAEKAPLVLEADEDARRFFSAVFDELIELCDQPPYAGILLNSVLVKLCTLTQALPVKPSISAISRAELYIRSNLKESLTLPMVAEQFGFSPSYFSRLFASQTGVTFQHYVRSLRLGYAKKLLHCSEMTVVQICEESGFRDYPNFIRRFRQDTGLSPTEYRKRDIE